MHRGGELGWRPTQYSMFTYEYYKPQCVEIRSLMSVDKGAEISHQISLVFGGSFEMRSKL